jgi:site-specific DNA-methyltransferase (adenine-specific)
MEGFLNFETLQAMNPSYTFNFDDRVKSTKQAKNNDFNRQMYSDKTNQKYKEHISKEYENYPRNTLYFDCERGQHPTQKPVALFEYLIRTYSNENEVILDNCSGSGTTAIACMNTNRRFICIERDETYHRKSIERMNNHEPLFHLGAT